MKRASAGTEARVARARASEGWELDSLDFAGSGAAFAVKSGADEPCSIAAGLTAEIAGVGKAGALGAGRDGFRPLMISNSAKSVLIDCVSDWT